MLRDHRPGSSKNWSNALFLRDFTSRSFSMGSNPSARLIQGFGALEFLFFATDFGLSFGEAPFSCFARKWFRAKPEKGRCFFVLFPGRRCACPVLLSFV